MVAKMANGDRIRRFYNPYVPFSSTVSHTSPHLAKYHYSMDNEDFPEFPELPGQEGHLCVDWYLCDILLCYDITYIYCNICY